MVRGLLLFRITALRAAASVYGHMWNPWTSRLCSPRIDGGSYRVLDVSDKSMTVKVTLNPGHGMKYYRGMKKSETAGKCINLLYWIIGLEC